MVLQRSKKLLVITVVLFIFLLLVGLLLFFLFSNNDTSEDQVTDSATELDTDLQEQNLKAAEVGQKYSTETENKQNEYIENIRSLDDLQQIPEEDRDYAGITVINNLVSENKNEEAQQFIDYVMTFQTGYGLEASRLCYITAASDARKSECLNIMTVKAIEQGIINQGEELPVDYYQQSEQELG